MHLERGNANEKPGTTKLLGLSMVPQHMANVLTKEAFNALAKLLNTIEIALVHFPLCISSRREGWNLLVDFVIPGHIRDEVLEYWKRVHGFNRHRLIQRQRVKPCLACEARLPINFGRTRPALTCLAVPAHGEVGRKVCLNVVQDIQHYHSRRKRNFVLNEVSAVSIATKYFEGYVSHGLVSRLLSVVSGP
jgi:hypothetical protein